MEFDYSKLKGKIKEIYETQEKFSKALGISDASLTSKLNNRTSFSQREIIKSINFLELENVEDYFFNLKLAKKQEK